MKVYDLFAYGAMIVDRSRDLYVEALVQRVKEGDRVLDLGTGTGYFALAALKQGASKVYAIDIDAEALKWIEPCAWENGVKPGSLTAICKDVADLSLDDLDGEKVDLLIWDTRGSVPNDLSVSTVVKARKYLKPGGDIISRRDNLFVALVEDSVFWGALSAPWSEDGVRGVKMTSCKNACLDRFFQHYFSEGNLLSDPLLFKEIDYAQVRDKGNLFKNSLTLEVGRKAVLHGFALWFDSEIDDGVWISNKPGKEDSGLYRQLFFPLREPCLVAPGYKANLNLNLQLTKSSEGVLARCIRNGSIVDDDGRLVMSFEQDG